MCIKCLYRLNRSQSTIESLCEQCLWPICGAECITSINTNIHNEECKILAIRANKIAKKNDYMYNALTPLKFILLQLTDKTKWNSLMEFPSHIEHRGPDSEVYEYTTNNLIISIIKCCIKICLLF